MIFIYNEKEQPMWDIKKKNDYFYRLESKNLGMDISKLGLGGKPIESIINDGVLKTALNLPRVDKPTNVLLNTVCSNNERTMIVFDKRNLNPFIHSISEKARYNNNVFFCSFDMVEFAIYSVRIYNGNIHAYDYDTEAKTFNIIFSLQDEVSDNEGKRIVPSLRIIGTTNDGSIYRKRITTDKNDPKKFILSYNIWEHESQIPKNAKGLRIVSLNDDRTDDLSDIRIKIYRPKRPSSTVIIQHNNEEGCKSILQGRYHIDPEKVKIFTPDSKKGGIKGLVSYLRRTKVDTVTYFCDQYSAPDVKKEIKNIRHEILENSNGKQFKTVQLLTADGVIIYLK